MPTPPSPRPPRPHSPPFPAPIAGGAFRPGGPARHKTSLIVLVDHKPGMLALTLQAFGARGVNLMALQSRPERSAPWTYRFYVDVEGSATDPRRPGALHERRGPAAAAHRR